MSSDNRRAERPTGCGVQGRSHEPATRVVGWLGKQLGGASHGSPRPPGELVVGLNRIDAASLPAVDTEPPCLLPLATSQRRGVLYAAWDALDNVLVAGDEPAAV